MRVDARTGLSRLLAGQGVTILLSFVAVLGLLYLGRKSFADASDAIDFKYLWVAGRLWSAHLSPYQDAYVATFKSIFGFAGAPFLYPPQWFTITVPLSWLPFATAVHVWRIANFGISLGVATTLLLIARRSALSAQRIVIALAILDYFLFLQAVPIDISMGQTSELAALGSLVFYLGVLTKRPVSTIVGVILLSFKPQLAVIPIAGVFVLGLMRREIISGVVLSFLCAIPALVTAGLRDTIVGFVLNTSLHGAIRSNRPENVTGLDHLASLVTTFSMSSFLWIGMGAIAAMSISAALRRHFRVLEHDARIQAFVVLALFPSLTCFFVPLHNYDTVILIPVLLTALSSRYPGQPFVLGGLALAFRPLNLVQLFGAPASQTAGMAGNLVLSIAYTLVLTGVLISLVRLDSLAVPTLRPVPAGK